MKNILLIIFTIISFLTASDLYAQKDRKLIREGNREFKSGNYEDSEILYRKAEEKTNMPFVSSFNIGDALYKQEKHEESAAKFKELAEQTSDNMQRAASYHNLGNAYLQANKLEESIEAYKNALRKNPGDLETKYNLAFAQDKLKNQQQQDKNKDKNKDKDKDKDQNKDKNKDQQDQKNKDQQNQENKDQQDKEKQQPQQQDQISKEDAQRILQAMENDEKKVQEKVKKAKAAKARSTRPINW